MKSRFLSSALYIVLFNSFCFSQLTVLKEINIDGNKRTKDFVILRELLLQLNQEYATESLDELLATSHSRLLNLNLFNKVNITDTIKGDGLYLTVKVVEKWYDWPIPFVEFSDRNFNVWKEFRFDKDRTNYGVYLFNYNLFGRNHTLKSAFVTGYNTRLGLEYTMPFISRHKKWGLFTKLNYSEQDELWLKTERDKLFFYKNSENKILTNTQLLVGVSKRLSTFVNATVSGEINKGKISDSALIVPSVTTYFYNQQATQTLAKLQLSMAYENVDNHFLPSKGNALQLTTSYNYIQSNGSLHNIHLISNVGHYRPLRPRLFFSANAILQWNSSQKLPYSLSRQLGYQYFAQGYENYVIDGYASALGGISLRYLLIKPRNIPLKFVPAKNYTFLPLRVYIIGHSDAGYVQNKIHTQDNILPNSPLVSGGIGIQALFYNDRVARISFSINGRKESGIFAHFKRPF